MSTHRVEDAPTRRTGAVGASNVPRRAAFKPDQSGAWLVWFVGAAPDEETRTDHDEQEATTRCQLVVEEDA